MRHGTIRATDRSAMTKRIDWADHHEVPNRNCSTESNAPSALASSPATNPLPPRLPSRTRVESDPIIRKHMPELDSLRGVAILGGFLAWTILVPAVRCVARFCRAPEQGFKIWRERGKSLFRPFGILDHGNLGRFQG